MANQDAAIMGMREMERQGMGGGGSPGRPQLTPGGAHYAASKAGVDGLTRHLVSELAPEVRVNSVQPRTIDTELFQARYAHAPLEQGKLLSQIPLRRIASRKTLRTRSRSWPPTGPPSSPASSS